MGFIPEIIDQGGHGWYMTDRSTSNQPNEVPKPSPEGHPNTVKRNEGPTKATDTTPTSEPLAEQPETQNEKPRL